MTEKKYLEHDCHLSPEDGCQVCEEYAKWCEEQKDKYWEGYFHDIEVNRLLERQAERQNG